SCVSLCSENSSYCGGYGPGAGFLNAPHAHAKMLGVDDNHAAFGFQLVHEHIGKLCSKPLLDLGPFSEILKRPGQFAEPHYSACRYVSNMRFPNKRQKV